MLRLESRMPPAAEALASRVIGCAIAVHRELGPGFLESVYLRALCLELALAGLVVESEKPVPISYRGEPVGAHRLDLVVGNCVIVETKSVERFDASHVAQLVSYLKATGLRLGLLFNFRVAVLRQGGIRRVVF